MLYKSPYSYRKKKIIWMLSKNKSNKHPCTLKAAKKGKKAAKTEVVPTGGGGAPAMSPEQIENLRKTMELLNNQTGQSVERNYER